MFNMAPKGISKSGIKVFRAARSNVYVATKEQFKQSEFFKEEYSYVVVPFYKDERGFIHYDNVELDSLDDIETLGDSAVIIEVVKHGVGVKEVEAFNEKADRSFSNAYANKIRDLIYEIKEDLHYKPLHR